MKQAENMNVIAHVNFQIRQAWKLLTWRYRILGTFGFRRGDVNFPNYNQHYPFELVDVVGLPNVFNYFGSGGPTDPTHPGGMACNNLMLGAEKLGVQDIPFFCVGHSGFKGWPQSESMCQLNCDGFGAARAIVNIPNAGTYSGAGQFGGDTAGAINDAIDAVNSQLKTRCEILGPMGATVLTRFLAGYINEIQPRSKTIEALAANLSLEADKILDIEGNTIIKGSKATLENNLTEANLTSFRSNPGNFSTENGLFGNSCSFGSDGSGGSFLKKIEIDFIRYFIHNCINNGGANNFQPESVYNPANGQLGLAFSGINLQERNILESLLTPGQQHTVGYEKNPYCIEYYAVKASSEPQIPFLPLTKIKLNAFAIAKPFGGSIGPWYGKTWPKGSQASTFDDTNQATKTDETLPIRNVRLYGGSNALSQSVYSQPNFSLFVGDKKGLRDSDYLAAYHSALAMRDIDNYPGKTNKTNQNFLVPNELKNLGAWPDFPNWNGLQNAAIGDFRDYDSMATLASDAAGTRALEISAIAPNQFDVTHYSIEPDFYNNYYKKLYNSGWQKILTATNRNFPLVNQLRADFGAVSMRADQPEVGPLEPRTFAVKDQIFIKNIVMGINPSITNGMTAPNSGKQYTQILNFLVSLQSSLLTSWTFLSFSNYTTFPGGLVDNLGNTMSFGQCKDSWNNTASGVGALKLDSNFKTPMDQDSNLPPTPGNCVTGGRTGYSVKLISPNQVRDSSKLENPINANFFSF